ncbi:MAG: hypothetical protein AAF488_19000 [Planctomycetota bacterium]
MHLESTDGDPYPDEDDAEDFGAENFGTANTGEASTESDSTESNSTESANAGPAGSFDRATDAPLIQLRIPGDRHLHPWVYRKTIRRAESGLRDGDEVVVVGSDGTAVGRGFYHGSSTIAVRILTRDPDLPLDAEFLRYRVETAAALRRDTLLLERRTNAYRVIHSEGDGLSGLVVVNINNLPTQALPPATGLGEMLGVV